MPEDLLTVAEAAELLRLNQQTLRNWIYAGALSAVRVGRRVRIPREELEALAGTGEISAEDLLTVAEVAEVLRMNPQTVRNWIDAGALPAVHIGRRVRIRRVDFEAIMEHTASRAAETTAEDFWLGTQLGERIVPMLG